MSRPAIRVLDSSFTRARIFQRHGGEDQWVAIQEARLPVLRNRLHAFIVPGGNAATFRRPETAQLLRARVTQVMGWKEP